MRHAFSRPSTRASKVSISLAVDAVWRPRLAFDFCGVESRIGKVGDTERGEGAAEDAETSGDVNIIMPL